MKDLIEKFHELRKSRENQEDMNIYESVSVDLFAYVAEKNPDFAKKMLDKLCAIKWEQYVSHEEAHKIVSSLHPQAKWSHSTLMQHLEALGLEDEEDGVYNYCALWVVMSAIYSDHAKTLACMLGKQSASEVSDEVMVKAIHALALDMLKDKDEYFKVRRYFSL